MRWCIPVSGTSRAGLLTSKTGSASWSPALRRREPWPRAGGGYPRWRSPGRAVRARGSVRCGYWCWAPASGAWSCRRRCPTSSATTSRSLIDQADGFVFGFSKLDVMFGRRTAETVVHPYADIVKPGVRFVQTDDPVDRPRGAAGRDRRRLVRRRRDGGRARRRPRPVGDARAGRGRPRVLHRGRGVRRRATCWRPSTADASSSVSRRRRSSAHRRRARRRC